MKIFWYTVLLVIVGYFIALGARPLMMPDEFRHAEIAREMAADRTMLSPHLLGVRYFEKPVFCHHFNMFSLRCFGENAFALRLPAALFTLLTGGLIAFVIWRRRKDAKLAALAFGFYMSFLLVYVVGTIPLTDAPLTFFTTAALFSAFLASQEPPFSRSRFVLEILCGLALTGGFFTKGAIALAVPGISIFCFLLWEKKGREFYRMPSVILPVFLLAGLPLAWKIHQAEPDFWNYFINVEHFQRFTGNAAGQHPRPWWYFLPVLALGALPGISFLPCLFRLDKNNWSAIFSRPIYRMALCAFVFPFLFFSASNGKLPTYILPCFPPLAILLAGGVMTYLRESPASRVFGAAIRFWITLLWAAGIGALFAATAATPGVLAKLPTEIGDAIAALRTMLAVLGTLGLLFGAALFAVRKKRRTLIFSVFFGGVAILACAVNALIPPELNNAKMPSESIRAAVRESGVDPENARVVAIRTLGYAVAWTLHCDTMLYPSEGELRYGVEKAKRRGEPHPLKTIDELRDFVEKGDRPLLFFTQPDKTQIRELTPRRRIIDRNVQLDIY